MERPDSKADVDPDQLLDEQVAYYRARAPEYDRWWLRSGRYDLGDDFRRTWEGEQDELLAALAEFAPRGRVLEVAAGTGNYTRELLAHADHVTALDASPETLAINRAKVEEAKALDRTSYVLADVFDWEPPEPYDVVFFSFWLSHVPPGRFERFWSLVGRALAPGGRVFFIDNARSVPRPWSIPDTARGISLRRLEDGRQFRVVKVLWRSAALERRLAELEWQAEVSTTASFFMWGTATRRR